MAQAATPAVMAFNRNGKDLGLERLETPAGFG
jgi:hypothetical protein